MTTGELYAEAFPAKRFTGIDEDDGVIPTEERYRLLGAPEGRRQYLLGLASDKPAAAAAASTTVEKPRTRAEIMAEIAPLAKKIITPAEYKPSTRSEGTAIVGDVSWFIRFGEDGFGGDKVRWSRPKVKWELWPEVNAVAIKPPSATGGSQAESGGGGSSVLTGSQAPSPKPRQGGTHPGPTPGTRSAASSEPAAPAAQPAAAAPNAANDDDGPEETKRSARRKRKKERDVRQIADLEEETRRLRERLTAVKRELAVYKKAEEAKRPRTE